MNAKKAKALRKQLGYKPTDSRSYDQKVTLETVTVLDDKGQPVDHKIPKITHVNKADSSRGQYRAAKRALRAG